MEDLVPGSDHRMVLRMPFVRPIMAKFGDARAKGEVGLDTAVRPLHMFTQTEVIEEFESETVEEKDKTSEYWKQKKSRRYFKKKDDAKVFLKDGIKKDSSSSGSGIRRVNYEGTKQASKLEGAAGPKYVLLKLHRGEVSVLPTGDWYNFHKMVTQEANISLDDIDHSFDQLQANKKEANKKYRNISRVLADSTAGGGGEGGGQKKGKQVGRALFTGIASMGASDDAGEGPIDNRFDDVFGDAHSRLLGKAVKKGVAGKLNRNPLANEKVSSHTDSWDNQYGDWGVDKEAEDIFEEGVSDDDASFVAEEQGMLEGQDAYTAGKIGGDDDDLFGSDSESSSDSDSDEEEENKPDALIDSGKQIRMLRGDKAAFAPVGSSSSGGSGGGGDGMEVGGAGDGKGKSKRKRDDMEGSDNAAGTGADGEQAGDDRKRSRPDSPSAQSVGSDGGGAGSAIGVVQLTDANVAAFVQAQPGGRTSFRGMGMHFKKDIKALNKKIKGSGDARFLGIVKRILTKFEDPALGPVFKLK